MTLELRPLGVRCNINCEYCYQSPQRDAGNVPSTYDLAAMKAAVARHQDSFTLFGGEPLLLPIADLEELWAFGYARSGHNGIQTNGSLITEAHLELFRKYKVHVGLSIDGPGALNDARRAGSIEQTRQITARSLSAIDRLCAAGMPPSLIVTLHRGNASAAHLPILHDWMHDLDRHGVTSVRLHVLEVDHESVRQQLALTVDENVDAFLSFARLEGELPHLRFDLFDDLRAMLLGRDDDATCVWRACDPYTTHAVQGIEGHGETSNCGRTNKDGIDFIKTDVAGYERYLALYHTPQESGGCRGCRFFLMCKGQCPGTSIGGDWRNRSEHCEVWKRLYRHFEDRLLDAGVIPVSARPERRALEARAVAAWERGVNVSIHALLRRFTEERLA